MTGWTRCSPVEAVYPKGELMATDKPAEQLQSQENIYGAHRPYVSVRFQAGDMDFAFQWILGGTHNGGCEIGEAFYAASRMADGDPESWVNEWLALARRVEKRANQSLQDGHIISARSALFRAANYYRAILSAMNPLKPEYLKIGHKCRTLFGQAAGLLDPPMEYVEIAFEQTMLPGYFRPAPGGEKNKTLIMIGGGETITEELYFFIGPEACERGYNFLSTDIPGQGLMPAQGQVFRPDTEAPLGAVVDYALSRPEVDPNTLAMYGISGGGYYVPRAATHDGRIKAIALNSAVTDGYELWQSMDFSQDPSGIADWDAFKLATFGVTAWRYGLDPANIAGLSEVNQGHVYDPAEIVCPALVLIGDGEYANQEIKRQQKEFLDGISSTEKKFIVTKQDEGAASHCTGVNRSLMSALVFDWLDEVF